MWIEKPAPCTGLRLVIYRIAHTHAQKHIKLRKIHTYKCVYTHIYIHTHRKFAFLFFWSTYQSLLLPVYLAVFVFRGTISFLKFCSLSLSSVLSPVFPLPMPFDLPYLGTRSQATQTHPQLPTLAENPQILPSHHRHPCPSHLDQAWL